jgi:large subunit ribosomal protein L19
MNRTKWNNQVTFNVGDTIKVHQNIVEGEKSRTQIFQGIVIRIKGHQGLTSFTVRKISTSGIGVERIYPLNAPIISKIEVVKKGKVKRAKLYYLRDRVGKKAKVQDSFVKKQEIEAITPEPLVVEKTEKVEKSEDVNDKKEAKPLEASNKSELKRAARERRKAKKKKKVERVERKDIR